MSDARMPNMDGAMLLGEIHANYPTTTRILLTDDADLPTIIKIAGLDSSGGCAIHFSRMTKVLRHVILGAFNPGHC